MSAAPDGQGGYVADVAYPGRFHRETMPAWLHAVATALGFAAPDIARSYAWCELGCGDGVNALVAAATNPAGRFVGVDANPLHIDHARALAERCGVRNIAFVHADFRTFADAADGTPFDFIVSHGVWSWVAPEHRRAMLDVVERRLRPGGLACMAYMSHPGASPMAAVQKLMHEQARQLPGDSAARAVAALETVQRLADSGCGGFAEHPGIEWQLEAMHREEPAYLAHEFLAEHWQPQHVADVIRAFAGRGCGFLGSATPLENIDAVSLPGNVLPLLHEAQSVPLQETIKDVARNQSLRRDLYQRDARPMPADRHMAALDALRFAALPGAPVAGGLRFDTRIGPVPGPEEIFDPLLRALAEAPRGFAELRRLPAFATAPGLLNQALQMLVWAGCAHPLRMESGDSGAALALEAVLVASPRPLRLLPACGSAAPG